MATRTPLRHMPIAPSGLSAGAVGLMRARAGVPLRAYVAVVLLGFGPLVSPAAGGAPTVPMADPVEVGAVDDAQAEQLQGGSRPLGTPSSPLISRSEGDASERAWGELLDLGRSLGSLVLVIAMIGGLAWVLRVIAKRTGGGLVSAIGPGGSAPSGIVSVLGRYPVARGLTLVLLKLDRRVLLLAQTTGSRGAGPTMSTISELSDPEEVASILEKVRDAEGDSSNARFREIVARFEKPGASFAETASVASGANASGGRGDGIEVVDLTRRPRAGRAHASRVPA